MRAMLGALLNDAVQSEIALVASPQSPSAMHEAI
jgi:hypothetical protein